MFGRGNRLDTDETVHTGREWRDDPESCEDRARSDAQEVGVLDGE